MVYFDILMLIRLKERISKCRYLPVEVFRTGLPAAGRQRGKVRCLYSVLYKDILPDMELGTNYIYKWVPTQRSLGTAVLNEDTYTSLTSAMIYFHCHWYSQWCCHLNLRLLITLSVTCMLPLSVLQNYLDLLCI